MAEPMLDVGLAMRTMQARELVDFGNVGGQGGQARLCLAVNVTDVVRELRTHEIGDQDIKALIIRSP